MRTVVVTGAGGGIGEATANRFVSHGDRVCGTDLSFDETSHEFIEVVCDVTDAARPRPPQNSWSPSSTDGQTDRAEQRAVQQPQRLTAGLARGAAWPVNGVGGATPDSARGHRPGGWSLETAGEEHIVRFRTNKILEKNRQGRKGLGLGLIYPGAEAIEIVGMLGGFDFVQLDGEHGLFSPESIDEMCRVADGFGLNVIARVPSIDGSTINSYLDRGVIGIWGPHIETAEEAQALVDASLFGPDGQRSWGGGRGNYYNNSALIDIPGGERTEYMRQTNANTLVLCQLESARAFENLDAILEVEGIDGYVFGPNDLAQSMGLPGRPDHPGVVAAERRVAERIHAAGGKLHTDLFAVIELRHLIVDGARRFLAENV